MLHSLLITTLLSSSSLLQFTDCNITLYILEPGVQRHQLCFQSWQPPPLTSSNPLFSMTSMGDWTCIPLVVEVYGGWGCEAQGFFSRLSKRLAMQVGVCETEALSQMYCLLGVTLMRQNARAILLRCAQTPLQDC